MWHTTTMINYKKLVWEEASPKRLKCYVRLGITYKNMFMLYKSL